MSPARWQCPHNADMSMPHLARLLAVYNRPEPSPAPPVRELPPTPRMRQPSPSPIPRGPPSLLLDEAAANSAVSRFRPPSPGIAAKTSNVGSNLLMDPDDASLGQPLPDHLAEAMNALASVAANYGWSRGDAPSSSASSTAVEGSIGLGAVSYPRPGSQAPARDAAKGADPVAAVLGGGMGILSHPPAPKGSARARTYA